MISPSALNIPLPRDHSTPALLTTKLTHSPLATLDSNPTYSLMAYYDNMPLLSAALQHR